MCQSTRTTVPAHTPALITGVGACALLHSSAASFVAISSQALVLSGQQAWAEQLRQRGRQRVDAVYGVLCALLALCDALLTAEGGNSTLQVSP